MLCGRNAEALEELSQELAASRAPEVSEPGGLAWGRGAVCPLRVFTVLREGLSASSPRHPQYLFISFWWWEVGNNF